jgi:YfiH family protein
MAQRNRAEAAEIRPDWPYTDRIGLFCTLRTGGVSPAPFDSFNLAAHVGDDPDCVLENRRRLVERLGDRPVQWLTQVHGTRILRASRDTVGSAPEADGVWCDEQDLVLAILTADCLPVVLVDLEFGLLAAVHGGWRGLVGGVLEQALTALVTNAAPSGRAPVPGKAPLPGNGVVAWIGPGIGPERYEVGPEVLDAVRRMGDSASDAIGVGPAGKGHLDLFTLAESELQRLGVEEVYCERICTAGSADLYSHRRDGITGRMATLAWLR